MTGDKNTLVTYSLLWLLICSQSLVAKSSLCFALYYLFWCVDGVIVNEPLPTEASFFVSL